MENDTEWNRDGYQVRGWRPMRLLSLTAEYYLFSKGLAAATVIAKVNGELWDLERPFEKDSTLQLIKFDDEQGRNERLLCYLSL